MRASKNGGFTLIELMIVVAIIAILASLAYYNYSRYAFRARRADGQNLLTGIAAAEQRYYTNYNSYTSTITGNSTTSLGFSSANSDRGYYSAVAALGSAGQTYTLTATPAGPQAKDKCGSLTLTDTGKKSAIPGDTSNGSCW
ncbi:MAG: type IV pilin protein [Xanthomonadales bacterium PRO7]|nr:type IV pilin protein [Xanthomonadales bacterium PRO7]